MSFDSDNPFIRADKAFKENSTTTFRPDGRVSIRCKKGLWSVCARSYSTAEKEARHYFLKYYMDGEYDEIA